jgi:hypothetical protein
MRDPLTGHICYASGLRHLRIQLRLYPAHTRSFKHLSTALNKHFTSIPMKLKSGKSGTSRSCLTVMTQWSIKRTIQLTGTFLLKRFYFAVLHAELRVLRGKVSEVAPIPFTNTVVLASYTDKRGRGKKTPAEEEKDNESDVDKEVDTEDIEYYDVDPHVSDAVLKRGRSTIDLFTYVGKNFEDIEEPDATTNAFTMGRVVAVCTCNMYHVFFLKVL